MMTIQELAQLAATETGVEITQIRQSVDTPTQPSKPVADIEGWRERYNRNELRADDPPPVMSPGMFFLSVRGSERGAQMLERWFLDKGYPAFGVDASECWVDLVHSIGMLSRD